MAEIKYTGTLAGLRVQEFVFPRGENVECRDELAEKLLDRADFDLAVQPKPTGKGKSQDTGVKAE
jgi:hypothetical protein